MARYERSYSGPRRTAPLRVQLTPDERDELEKAAEGQGAPNLSTYARELYSAAPPPWLPPPA